MLKTEFEERTGYRPSEEEYAAIEQAYNASDMLKDDFCAIWRRYNKSKIDAVQEKQDLEDKIESYTHHIEKLKEEAKFAADLAKQDEDCGISEEVTNHQKSLAENAKTKVREFEEYLKVLKAIQAIR